LSNTANVVLTSFFTGHIDPQRKTAPEPDSSLIADLYQSVKGRFVLLHNCFGELPYENYRVEAPQMAYRQRWLSQWQWLRNHPEVEWAWLVDATDTEMLREPWEHMRPGILYTGWEPAKVGIPWIRKHSSKVLDWIDKHADEPLLNCGVVGGDRDTVMTLCRRMTDLWAETGAEPLHEMAFFNMSARKAEYITGPRVTTTFKAFQDNGQAYFRHK